MQDHLRLDPIFPFSCRQIEGKALFLQGGRKKKKKKFRAGNVKKKTKKKRTSSFRRAADWCGIVMWGRGRFVVEENDRNGGKEAETKEWRCEYLYCISTLHIGVCLWAWFLSCIASAKKSWLMINRISGLLGGWGVRVCVCVFAYCNFTAELFSSRLQ